MFVYGDGHIIFFLQGTCFFLHKCRERFSICIHESKQKKKQYLKSYMPLYIKISSSFIFYKWIFQNYCMCKWDSVSLKWFSHLFAGSVVKGFGLLPAANQGLSFRTRTLCAWASPESFSPFIGTEQNKFSPTVIIAPVVAAMFAVSQESSRTFYQHSEESRTAFSRSWCLKDKGTKADLDLSRKWIIPFCFGIVTANCSYPACYFFQQTLPVS